MTFATSTKMCTSETIYPLLSIAIPTYNRAAFLDKQLAWLAEATSIYRNEVELIVSDNASTDRTPEVCTRWQAECPALKVTRHPRNIGFAANCIHCLHIARGEYVWLVSDDDSIQCEAVSRILEDIKAYQPASIILGYVVSYGYEGELIDEKIHLEGLFEDGKLAYMSIVSLNEWFLSSLMAGVYKRALALEAVAAWPAVKNNSHLPLYLQGYVAARGAVLVRRETTYIQPVSVHTHVSEGLITIYHDAPLVYWQLLNSGYPPGFIRSQILRRASILKMIIRFPLHFLRALRLYRMAERLPRTPIR